MDKLQCVGPIPSEAELLEQIKVAHLTEVEAKVLLCHYGYGDPDNVEIQPYRHHPSALRGIMQSINNKLASRHQQETAQKKGV